MLRDEIQLALNDLTEAVLQAAEQHARAADICADAGLAKLFQGLAQRRRRFGDRLKDEVRRADDLPRTPDTDAETVKEVVSRVKATLSGDTSTPLLEASDAAEAKIAQAVEATAAVDLPDPARALIEELRADIDSARAQLRPAD